MNWSTGLSWFKPFQSWHVKRSDEPDHADMGTAFGLDASMAPMAMESAAPAGPSTHTSRPWEHRLTRRTSL
jgi:hypothetical protein